MRFAAAPERAVMNAMLLAASEEGDVAAARVALNGGAYIECCDVRMCAQRQRATKRLRARACVYSTACRALLACRTHELRRMRCLLILCCARSP